MSIARLVYVMCDRCGKPCGHEGDMAENAREARVLARRRGWTRADGEDLCPQCRNPPGQDRADV